LVSKILPGGKSCREGAKIVGSIVVSVAVAVAVDVALGVEVAVAVAVAVDVAVAVGVAVAVAVAVGCGLLAVHTLFFLPCFLTILHFLLAAAA
jgi:hypothetical protein